MALSKNVDTDVGVPATYWRITRVEWNIDGRSISFILAGYASQQARTAGKAAMMTEHPLAMPLTDGQKFEDVGRSQLYDFAKTVVLPGSIDGSPPLFADAESV